MKNDNEREKESNSDYDFFGLGGLFKGIEKLIDIAGKLEYKEISGSVNEKSFEELSGGIKGVYGFTIKSALGNSTKIETFGNIVKTANGPVVNKEREPITDIFNESDEVVIIAEMPGVEEKEIMIDIKDDILEISTSNENKIYHKEILIPVKSDNKSIESKYTNGILEIRIKK